VVARGLFVTGVFMPYLGPEPKQNKWYNERLGGGGDRELTLLAPSLKGAWLDDRELLDLPGND
jgi:hypothetical protein